MSATTKPNLFEQLARYGQFINAVKKDRRTPDAEHFTGNRPEALLANAAFLANIDGEAARNMHAATVDMIGDLFAGHQAKRPRRVKIHAKNAVDAYNAA
jgi:hypothetical protein